EKRKKKKEKRKKPKKQKRKLAQKKKRKKKEERGFAMRRVQRKRKRSSAFDSPVRVASPARKVDTIAELCVALRGGKLEPPNNASADDVADALDELDAFIGVESVKRVVLEMVLLSCLRLSDARDFTNVVLTGNPGTGKTELCGVVSRVWRSVFHGKRGRVTWLCRAQLIGEHLGETSMKTMRALSSAIPGVVVLDEVYALGSGERDKDSFSKECIDAINQFLSECRESITVIVAGYRDETERCFFARNQGLERRFPWVQHRRLRSRRSRAHRGEAARRSELVRVRRVDEGRRVPRGARCRAEQRRRHTSDPPRV
ncbi:MAG: AAA family ATPase, partial [Chitinophagia bacterium]|nr:AAA family ATPase [Chitinophagia bacterium]